MNVKKRVVLGTCLLALACLGCSQSGPDVAGVEGKVTLDGEPLAEATVVFIPENGRPAAAQTDAGGNYVLTFSEGRKGALPGKNKIRINTGRDASEDADGNPMEARPETVPMKYNSQSTLEFVVEDGKKNTADFDLESDPGDMPAPDSE